MCFKAIGISFILKCLHKVSPRIFHIREGVGTCQTPIQNWGLVNDLCCLVPAPPKYRGSTSHKLLMCRVCFYYVRRSVLFKLHAANIEASKFVCFVGDGNNFPNPGSMLLLQLP